MSIEPVKPAKEMLVSNYCASFIDLLGQRAALNGQGLLPPFGSEEEKRELNAKLKESVGAIISLQRLAETMLKPLLNPNPQSSLRASLPPEMHTYWDEMSHTRVKTQRWSDGLVSFVCLSNDEVKCQMNGVFALFAQAATLCFLGLANRCPIRGGIEVAWGVELHPDELYGAVVARAYELESEVAQYPRIVVGFETVGLLETFRNNPEQDIYSQANRTMAELCMGMLIQDVDGYWIMHYLGKKCQYAITHNHHAKLYAAARKFVHDQLLEHQANLNTKLALRYSYLMEYFDAHQPVATLVKSSD